MARLLALTCSLLLASCQTDSPAGEPSTRDPVELLERVCSRCHLRHDLEGSDADDIREAMNDVPTMRRLRARLTDGDVLNLGRLLSETASPP